METITVYPRSESEAEFIKEFLSRLEVFFNEGKAEEELTDWQKKKILKGFEDLDNGKFKTSEQVRQKVRQCIE